MTHRNGAPRTPQSSNGRGVQDPPYDMFMSARMLLCRHMRLAFEEDVDWLVEMLEREREAGFQ